MKLDISKIVKHKSLKLVHIGLLAWFQSQPPDKGWSYPELQIIHSLDKKLLHKHLLTLLNLNYITYDNEKFKLNEDV